MIGLLPDGSLGLVPADSPPIPFAYRKASRKVKRQDGESGGPKEEAEDDECLMLCSGDYCASAPRDASFVQFELTLEDKGINGCWNSENFSWHNDIFDTPGHDAILIKQDSTGRVYYQLQNIVIDDPDFQQVAVEPEESKSLSFIASLFF